MEENFGEISDEVGKFIYSDKELLKRAQAIIDEPNGINGIIGTIASGDRFVTGTEFPKMLIETFDADAVEMEGASIAQVCFLDKVPFIVVRSISDTPNDNNKVDFDKFIESSAKIACEFVKRMI